MLWLRCANNLKVSCVRGTEWTMGGLLLQLARIMRDILRSVKSLIIVAISLFASLSPPSQPQYPHSQARVKVLIRESSARGESAPGMK
jgi:hypothetical protein